MKIRLQSSSSGIALVIVMLVILVLATLAGAFALSMKVEVTLARNSNYESELEWLGRSGVELAKFVIAEQAKIPGEGSYESLNQKWAGGQGGIAGSNSVLAQISMDNIPLGGGTISVKVTDLERKFNINVADKPVLQQALVVLMGVDASLVSTISDSILDWIDKNDDNLLSGAESAYYMGLNPPYVAKNGPLDDISELLLIKGILDNPEIYWGSASTNHSISAFQSRGNPVFPDRQQPWYPVGLVDIFTTLSNGRININTASVTTLQMIPGMDENIAAALVKYRSGLDGTEKTEDDVPMRSVNDLGRIPGMRADTVSQISRYCDVRSSTFEVQVDVDFNGVTRQYISVIRKGTRAGDFGILKFYWK